MQNISHIQAADILVTNSASTQSFAIRSGTCTQFSHAIMALGNGMCIEALSSGVRKVRLHQALSTATQASLYRYKGITAYYAQKVVNAVLQHEGKAYDFRGAVRSAISSGCSNVKRALPATILIEVHDELSKSKQEHDSTFFCSELIARAFEDAGLHLTKHPAHALSPGGLVKSEHLKFVKTIRSI